MKGARIIVESLLQEGVDTLFCYPGGTVITIFDELYKHGEKIRCIYPRHEQAGTHAADGYARSTGKPGVVLVTSGPGATNTITGIATAYMDSVPLVVITGQVPTHRIGTDAFQESDIVGITMPITKANFLVKNPEDLALTLKKAFHFATTGRPGPVLVDIPSNVQNAEVEFEYPETLHLPAYRPKEEGHPKQIRAAIELLKKSKKPLLMAGGGVVFSDASDELNSFADTGGIPVVHTLMGHGINPSREDLYIGTIGMHGSYYGNYAVNSADLILAVGVRFSDRIAGNPAVFAPNAKIIHVDIDPAEIGKNVKTTLPIVGPAKPVLKALSKELFRAAFDHEYSSWVEELQKCKKEHPFSFDRTGEILKSQALIEMAAAFFPEDTIVATDVGQNQMWTSQYFRFRQPRTLLTSGGLGTMGYGLPAAIGAAIGNPDRQVLMISGDGGFHMNMQELSTLSKYGLNNLKMLVLDNATLGMVRQWQELLYEKRYSGTKKLENPDFSKLAEVMGVEGKFLLKPGDAEKTIRYLAESKSPVLVHAIVETDENVFPMVPAGESFEKILMKF